MSTEGGNLTVELYEAVDARLDGIELEWDAGWRARWNVPPLAPIGEAVNRFDVEGSDHVTEQVPGDADRLASDFILEVVAFTLWPGGEDLATRVGYAVAPSSLVVELSATWAQAVDSGRTRRRYIGHAFRFWRRYTLDSIDDGGRTIWSDAVERPSPWRLFHSRRALVGALCRWHDDPAVALDAARTAAMPEMTTDAATDWLARHVEAEHRREARQ